MKRTRREKVAHIRFSPEEFAALEVAAGRVGMTVSAFVRSLSLEGAGERPFFAEADQAILALLARDMRAIGNNLNRVARAINTGRVDIVPDVALNVTDAGAIVATVLSELRNMARSAGATRRGEAG